MADTLALSGLEKSFGSNRVLRDVALRLPGGAVTVLMGANGAGKSTLVKILSGVHARDAGEIRLGGAPYAPRTPLEARAASVVTVHQGIDDGVVPDLDVAENLALEELATGRTGFLYRRSRVRARAREVAAGMGLELDVSRPVRELGLAERQLVAIARAMAADPRLLILDEPTSSLSAREAERLFALIDRLRERGVAVLYISHRTSDIERVADRIVAMRDGRVSGTFEGRPLEVAAAVEAMLGRTVSTAGFEARDADGGAAALELDAVRLHPDAAPVDLAFGRGEVVAVTGLVGSGKSALAETLFGLRRPLGGSMRLDGAPYAPGTVAEAIGRGVFMAPKDRASNAVVPDLDLAANLSLPFTRKHSTLGVLRSGAERDAARVLIERLGVVCRSPRDPIGTLSGGNQQKVVVARWLARPCRVLLLDEPFQGVDIQARRDIGATLRKGADARATIVFVAELDEALEVADRIVVMAHHGVAGVHRNVGIDLERVLLDVATAGGDAGGTTRGAGDAGASGRAA